MIREAAGRARELCTSVTQKASGHMDGLHARTVSSPASLSTTRRCLSAYTARHDACGIDAPCTVAAHAVVAVYMIIKFLPALRASAPQCLIWGMPIASLSTCIYDASQPESNTTAAHGLAQFANAPVLSMAGQVMLGVLLGPQPLPVRSRFVGVVLSIALWELNLLLVSQRTGNLAYLTALLPQTAAPLFSADGARPRPAQSRRRDDARGGRRRNRGGLPRGMAEPEKKIG